MIHTSRSERSINLTMNRALMILIASSAIFFISSINHTFLTQISTTFITIGDPFFIWMVDAFPRSRFWFLRIEIAFLTISLTFYCYHTIDANIPIASFTKCYSPAAGMINATLVLIVGFHHYPRWILLDHKIIMSVLNINSWRQSIPKIHHQCPPRRCIFKCPRVAHFECPLTRQRISCRLSMTSFLFCIFTPN